MTKAVSKYRSPVRTVEHHVPLIIDPKTAAEIEALRREEALTVKANSIHDRLSLALSCRFHRHLYTTWNLSEQQFGVVELIAGKEALFRRGGEPRQAFLEKAAFLRVAMHPRMAERVLARDGNGAAT